MTAKQISLFMGDALFLAALATIIIKLHLEKSSKGISAKAQGLYVVIFSTRYIYIVFLNEGGVELFCKLIIKLCSGLSSLYVTIRLKQVDKKECSSCSEDSFWLETLLIPVIILTAVLHLGDSPEQIFWSFSTYLEVGAMIPQFYLVHVRGKGDSYQMTYITFMACYSLCSAMGYSFGYFLDDNEEEDQTITWAICKIVQLIIYLYYYFIPREPAIPTLSCSERRRRPTLFMRQESRLAQSLFQKKNNSSPDLEVFVVEVSEGPVISIQPVPPKQPVVMKSYQNVGTVKEQLAGARGTIRRAAAPPPGTPVSLRSVRFIDPFPENRESIESKMLTTSGECNSGSSSPTTPVTPTSETDVPPTFKIDRERY